MKDRTVREFLLGAGILGKTPDGPAMEMTATIESEGLYVRKNIIGELDDIKKRLKNIETALNILMKAKKK